MPAEPYWSWDGRTRRYRVTSAGSDALGQNAGTFVSQKKMAGLRDVFISQQKNQVNGLAQQLADGDITLNQWVLGMRQNVKDSFIDQYMLSAGGRNNMTQSDWGRIGQMVRNQYEYLDGFASDIAGGRYTESGVAARSRMYVESSSQAFERGNTVTRGMPDLPAYPGDGSTQCLSNCRCRWAIKETETDWQCTWKLAAAEHCLDCVNRADEWNPLVVPKSEARSLPELRAHLEMVNV